MSNALCISLRPMIYNGLIQTVEYFCLPVGDLTLYAFSSSVRLTHSSLTR